MGEGGIGPTSQKLINGGANAEYDSDLISALDWQKTVSQLTVFCQSILVIFSAKKSDKKTVSS